MIKVNYFKECYSGIVSAFMVLFIMLVLFSCDNLSTNVEQAVDENISDSKAEMNNKIEKSKIKFINKYTKAINNNNDVKVRQNLQELHSSITQTATYLDSFKREMDRLDAIDEDNVEHVKRIFLYNGVGDSVFNKLKRSIAIAEEITLNQQSKIAIKNMRDSIFNKPDINKWREGYFRLTNPLGASMVLYGFQSELYRIGMESLR